MEQYNNQIIPILLSGGVGKRLWPLSRSSHPKQFLQLYNSKSLLQNTIARCDDIPVLDKPILVCNTKDRFIITAQLEQMKANVEAVILEPTSHNTAPAIAIATLFAIQHFGDPLLLIMPIDHKIDDTRAFLKYLEFAKKYAQEGKIITFGVTPTAPDTNYGYVEISRSHDEKDIYRVEKFKEKPDRDLAAQFYADKKHYWNSGIFLFKASRILQDFSALQPEILACARNAMDTYTNDSGYVRLSDHIYNQCPAISFDIAIIEKTSDIFMIPIDIPWTDIGNWQSLYNIDKKDDHGNVIHGNIIPVETQNCYLRTENKLVTTIGLKDCFVVETRDAILIANKNSLDHISDVTGLLESNHRSEMATSSTVSRPWGYYVSIEYAAHYQIKRIVIHPHQSISLQEHQYRSEHWIILKGKATVILGHTVQNFNPNESVFVPMGMKHRITNDQDTDLELIEIQTGNYLGEDDIKRFDDIYHREPSEI